MNENKGSNHFRYGRNDWHALVSEFSGSTLNRDDFCRSKAISPVRLVHWQRVFRLNAVKPPVAKIKSTFVDLGALKSEAPSLELKLDLGGDVVLTITRR